MIGDKPKAWSKADIGTLCDLINGRAFKSTEWSEAGLPIIRIQNLNNPVAKCNYFDGELSEKHRIENGDLLFAWSGTPGTSFGAHVWRGETAALNQHIFKIEFEKSLIEKRFLLYAINQTLDVLISGAHGGVGLRHVTKGKFEAAEISFPPLAEQKAIADTLDTLLAQVDNTKARLERIPDILKRFRQSVLAAAVSGRLTEVWRGNADLVGWQKNQLGQFIEKPSYGSSAKSQKTGDVPVLRMGNLQGGQLDWTDLVYTSDPSEIEKYRLENGDVLFNRTNSPELVGKTSIFRSEREAVYAGYLIKIKCLPGLEPEFLNYQLNSPKAKSYCKAVKSDGVSQSNINAKKLAAYPLNCPPLEEQTEIVRRVDQLFAYVDTIEQQVNNALERVNQLTQSILAKAFRGELTAQWREENPELISGENSAEALLAHIRAEREAIKRQPKQPKRTAGKKNTGSSMSKQVIKVVEALKQAGTPLSGQQLLAAAGYPSNSRTEELEQFFLDIRQALSHDKSIVKLERSEDGQDWFSLTEDATNE